MVFCDISPFLVIHHICVVKTKSFTAFITFLLENGNFSLKMVSFILIFVDIGKSNMNIPSVKRQNKIPCSLPYSLLHIFGFVLPCSSTFAERLCFRPHFLHHMESNPALIDRGQVCLPKKERLGFLVPMV